MSEEEQMLMEILGCRRVDLYLEKRSLTNEQQEKFDRMQTRRVEGEPLQYILGYTSFMGFKLFVDQRVLIPRPETELMVEAAVEQMHQMYCGQTLQVLDLGTGSGAIAIGIAKNFPDCEIVAVDISKDAIDVARTNAHFQNVFDQITFLEEDLTEVLEQHIREDEKYDLVISNPPYIPKDQMKKLPKDVQQEPKIALEGGKDGLQCISHILAFSPNVLRTSGRLMFEFWDGQSEGIFSLYEYFNNFKHIEFYKDYTQINRFCICRLKCIDPAALEEMDRINY